LTGIFIFFETFDTDQYLPRMTQKASQAIGRPVFIGHLGLGISSRGISLDAGPVIIADDPAFTKQPFIKIDKVRAVVDLRSLVLSREIHLTEILLQSPQIHFIRSEEGNFNARSIGGSNKKLNPLPPVGRVREGEVKSIVQFHPHLSSPIKGEGSLFPGININSIRIKDAAISFIDQNQAMPLDIWLTNINAILNVSSLSGPFHLSFDASSLLLKSITPGIPDDPISKYIVGNVQFNMASGEFAANGDINISDGVIKNYNMIKEILSHTLGVFSGMDAAIDKLGLGANDTIIKKAMVQFSTHDKALVIEDSLIDTNIFELTAKGTVDLGLNLDMQTMIHLNEDVTADLVSNLEGLKYLVDDSKRIAIGGSLKGVVPHIKYKPSKDFRKKSRKALIEEGGNILGILLGGG